MNDRAAAFIEAFKHDPNVSRLPLPGEIRKSLGLCDPGSVASISDVFANYIKSAHQMVNDSHIVDGTVEHKDVKFPELTYDTQVKYPMLDVSAETKFEDNK